MFEAVVMFSEALGVICELDMALDASLDVFAAAAAAVVGGDVGVVMGGSGFGTGGGGLDWGELGCLGGVVARLWGLLGWHSQSVECTMRSGEHIHTALCNSVSWAVDGVSASFTAC